MIVFMTTLVAERDGYHTIPDDSTSSWPLREWLAGGSSGEN
jgi:hypothetical protein